ncbi:hypothetical protein [Blastomonas sp.]|uniref:hypothetical protein n=1 Tax=Blastomonas sp. TaxID=1909299 RepID=UPI0026260BAC|nr:hypothetical protein [Blastomonas sp.]MDM7958050.1 hypothetical protein [Blastomonas sp.]
MPNPEPRIAYKSYQRQAFELYLRTGKRTQSGGASPRLERKFNPYHDPENGQFTFAPGGSRSGTSRQTATSDSNSSQTMLPGGNTTLTLAQYRPNPRARIGGNRGPRPYDPMTLEQAFPGLSTAPGSSIIGLADYALGITGPANRLTAELATAEVKSLIQQIRKVDPEFQFDSLGSPTTFEGQINQIETLRMHRAAAFYNKRGDVKPLQVEVLRQMQSSTDRAYEEGQALFEAGRLTPRLSRNEAIGNYIDRSVRRDMKGLFVQYGVEQGVGKPVRVGGREYNTSGSDRTYRIPDVRVGRMAYDTTMERKLQ